MEVPKKRKCEKTTHVELGGGRVPPEENLRFLSGTSAIVNCWGACFSVVTLSFTVAPRPGQSKASSCLEVEGYNNVVYYVRELPVL